MPNELLRQSEEKSRQKRTQDQDRRDRRRFKKECLIRAKPGLSDQKKNRYFELDRKKKRKTEESEELEGLKGIMGIGGWERWPRKSKATKERNRTAARENRARNNFEEDSLMIAIRKLSPEQKEELLSNIERMAKDDKNKAKEYKTVRTDLLFIFSQDLSLQELDSGFGLKAEGGSSFSPNQLGSGEMAVEDWDDSLDDSMKDEGGSSFSPNQLASGKMAVEDWDDSLDDSMKDEYGQPQIGHHLPQGEDVFDYSSSGYVFPDQWHMRDGSIRGFYEFQQQQYYLMTDEYGQPQIGHHLPQGGDVFDYSSSGYVFPDQWHMRDEQ